jgi:hypothetical protein
MVSTAGRARRVFLGSLAAGLMAGACSTSQPLPGFSVLPDASPAGVLLEGTLVSVPGSPCLQVKPLGEPAVGLLWAPGYTASTDPLRIYDPHGVEVASEGDTVTLSGGIIFSASSFCRTKTYFEVSDVTKGAIETAP